jgi:hypothetical protein
VCAHARTGRARRAGLKPWRILLLHAASDENATFSYQRVWPGQFQRHPRFSCTTVNLAARSVAGRIGAEARIRLWNGEAVVMLHSVFSNACLLSGRLFEAVLRRPQPKAWFIGNEYKLMPDKMRFADELQIALLVSQCRSAAVHELYRKRLGCVVTGIPNAGLDVEVFRSTSDPNERPIDLGYRADDSPWYLGHTERRAIAEYFVSCASKFRLSTDISLDRARRFTVPEWASFLNRCRGQLGTEAGGDFFELSDETRNAVNGYIREHPGATFEDVWERFFRRYEAATPLRILSSRHVEAAGTRTVQILFEGGYDGYFAPDIHYIPLKKDFSNTDDVIRKFADRAMSERIADGAHERVRAELTYSTLIDRFADTLAATV